VGSDLQKSDGLVVITHANLPEVVLGLELQEICGIGKRLEETAAPSRHRQLRRALRQRRLVLPPPRPHLSWAGDLGGSWGETAFHETRDIGSLLACPARLWRGVPRYKPLSVGVVLLDLVPVSRHQPDLFEVARREKLSPLIDGINDRYGRGARAGMPAPRTSFIDFIGSRIREARFHH